MVSDARSATKTYLEAYITPGNLTLDDDSTLANYMVVYGDAPYPVERVFTVTDLVLCVQEPTSEPLMDTDGVPFNYAETVPIELTCVDKPGLTATKMVFTCEAELRRICETYPQGSLRHLTRSSTVKKDLGGMILYSTLFTLSYVRDTT